MVILNGEKMRRKFLGIVLLAALIWQLIPGMRVAEADAASGIVRVELSVGAPASVPFYVDGNYTVEGFDGVSLDRQLYTVKLESGRLSLYYGATRLCGDVSSLKLIQRAPTPGRNNFIWLHNSHYNANLGYLGDMRFIAGSGGISVVNHVYIEDYLYGVVPHEMSNSWPVEALKAQAVAARNYAIGMMKTTGTYDLGDTSSHQVYKGFNAANTNAIAAVDQTAATALKCGGSLVDIYYSASNGGWTEITQHCWTIGTRLPYQIIQKDDYDIQNPSSLQEVLRFSKTAGTVTYSHSGGTATGTEAANVLKYLKDEALKVVPDAYQKASVDDIQLAGVAGITAHTYIDQHNELDYTGANPCICFKNANVAMNVVVKRKSDGGQETIPLTVTIDMTALAVEGGAYQAFNEPITRLRMFSVEETADEWRIWHRRYGHGIGLSQRGAQQRANSADPNVNTYDKILAFYFPNTALESLGYTRPALAAITPADSSNAAAVCPGTSLNIRSAPDSSTTANIIGNLPNGARISVTQKDAASGWHKVNYGGQDAYVSAAYVQIDGGAVIPPPTPTPTPTPAPYKLGDVNGDGAITTSDYTLIRLDILGLKALGGNARAAADVNADGAVTTSDYTLVRLDILGIKKIG